MDVRSGSRRKRPGSFLEVCIGFNFPEELSEKKEEVERLVNTCITELYNQEELFEEKRAHLIAREKMVDITDYGCCEGAKNSFMAHGRIVSAKEEICIAERITMGDVQRVLQWFRPKQRYTIVYTPQ